MSLEKVRLYLETWGKADRIRECAQSCATVELAARAAGVEPARIAKTLAFRPPGEPAAHAPAGCLLIVTAGDARVDAKKFKTRFGCKASMLSPEAALARTGHAVGGVCPFAIDNAEVTVWLDVSLQRFRTVLPACGSSNSFIELTLEELEVCSRSAGWVDVCRDWEELPATCGAG